MGFSVWSGCEGCEERLIVGLVLELVALRRVVSHQGLLCWVELVASHRGMLLWKCRDGCLKGLRDCRMGAWLQFLCRDISVLVGHGVL